MPTHEVRPDASGAAAHGDVAIIGMSCLFPGASDLDTYWQNIMDKHDAITDVPEE
jgi:acyl transferase domain-containing protein